MLHMGLLDEALFGKEVVERLPQIVKEWTKQADKKTVTQAGKKKGQRY